MAKRQAHQFADYFMRPTASAIIADAAEFVRWIDKYENDVSDITGSNLMLDPRERSVAKARRTALQALKKLRTPLERAALTKDEVSDIIIRKEVNAVAPGLISATVLFELRDALNQKLAENGLVIDTPGLATSVWVALIDRFLMDRKLNRSRR